MASYQDYIKQGWEPPEARRLAGILNKSIARTPSGCIDWSDGDNITLLKTMKAEGRTNAEIALRFETTRNAIIGKSSRMGLHGPSSIPNAKKKLKKPQAKRCVKTPRVTPTPQLAADQYHNCPRLKSEPLPEMTIESVIPLKDRVTIETLKASHCKWPIGDPKEDDFHFCGGHQQDGSVYCDFHHRKAHTPQTRNRTLRQQTVLDGRQA